MTSINDLSILANTISSVGYSKIELYENREKAELATAIAANEAILQVLNKRVQKILTDE